MVSPTGSQPSLAGTQASGSNSSLAGSQASGSSNASSGSLTRTQSLPNLTKPERATTPIQHAQSWPQMSLKQSCSLSSSLKALSGRNDAGSTRSSSPYDPQSPKTRIGLLDGSGYYGPHGEDAQDYDNGTAFETWLLESQPGLSEDDREQMQRDFEQVGNPLFVALKVGDIVYTGQTSAGPFGPQGVYQVQYGPHPTFAALFRSQGGVDSLYDAMREGFVGQYGPDLGGEISDVWQENNALESELLCRQGERAEAEELCGMFGDPDGEHNDPAMLELAQQVIGQKQQRIAELEQSLTEGRGKFIALLPV